MGKVLAVLFVRSRRAQRGEIYGKKILYYWLKLKADWFSDKRIKKLRSIAGGDTHTIICLKMLLLSLKDEGKLYFEGVEDSFASEIALALDEDAENVKLKLSFLQRHGLIEICDDDEYQLTEVPTIIGSETASTIRIPTCILGWRMPRMNCGGWRIWRMRERNWKRTRKKSPSHRRCSGQSNYRKNGLRPASAGLFLINY